MRLLNTTTLKFQEFFDNNIPIYAILSHRWETDSNGQSEEVSYKQFLRGDRRYSRGFQKINRFCALAMDRGYQWAWVDTCCIDKRSSAELSEAINAMFKWYKRSAVCFAYLSDVKTPDGFRESAWFTRGWTLQELLAPETVEFYDRRWNLLCDKASEAKTIEEITGIPRALLKNDGSRQAKAPVAAYSVAQRLSWVSRRQTSRAEDMTYCLLGLFAINMPLLYGEGEEAAFRRFQRELIASSTDESILAWNGGEMRYADQSIILAPSPRCFSRAVNELSLGPWTGDLQPRNPWQITSRGLRMQMHLLDEYHDQESGYFRYSIPLACSPVNLDNKERHPLILNVRKDFTKRGFEYRRFGDPIQIAESEWDQLLSRNAKGHETTVQECRICRERRGGIFYRMGFTHSTKQPYEHEVQLTDCPLREIYLSIWPD